MIMFVLKILQIYALNLNPNINKRIKNNYQFITQLILSFFIVAMIFLTNFHAIQQIYVIFYYQYSGKFNANPLQCITFGHITQAINKINSALMLNIWYWKRKQNEGTERRETWPLWMMWMDDGCTKYEKLRLGGCVRFSCRWERLFDSAS